MDGSHKMQTIGGTYEELTSYRHVWSGSDDYSKDAMSILDVVTRDGRRVEPDWTERWTDVAPGITAKATKGTQRLRIRFDACPVRVRVLEVSEYVASDPEFCTRSASERVVTYVSDGTSLRARVLFSVRARLRAVFRLVTLR